MNCVHNGFSIKKGKIENSEVEPDIEAIYIHDIKEILSMRSQYYLSFNFFFMVGATKEQQKNY